MRSINLDMGEDKVKLARLQLLGDIAACGVMIDYMQPPPQAVRQEDPSKCMDAMARLLPIAGPAQEQCWSGAQYISIDSNIDTYPGVFAALRANQSVSSVYFDPCVQQRDLEKKRRLAWSWLAYGILSKPVSGGHRVQDLLIVAETLDQIAFDGITTILRADDPLVLLFNLEVRRISQETVSASKFALVDPSTGGGSQNTVKWSSGQVYSGLEVIERGQDWMSVLLPGWGKAWVHCGDVEMAWPSMLSANQAQSIPNVRIRNMNIESKDAVAGLLRLIGRGIRHLDLEYDTRRSEVNELLPQIFQACPNLLSFETSCKKIDSLQVFIDAFAPRSCRLEKLVLGDIKLTNECDSLKLFFEALSDKENPIARRLKKFKMLNVQVAAMIDPNVAAALMTMLQTNLQLHHLELGFRREDSNHPQRATCGDQWQPTAHLQGRPAKQTRIPQRGQRQLNPPDASSPPTRLTNRIDDLQVCDDKDNSTCDLPPRLVTVKI